MRPTDDLVAEFHEAFGLPVHRSLRAPEQDRTRLRLRLLAEEFDEVRAEFSALLAARSHDQRHEALLRLAKELADLRYVADGAALELGIDAQAAFREVHRSNMSKLGADGKPIYREDGKVLKGEGYTEADMAAVQPVVVDGSVEDAA